MDCIKSILFVVCLGFSRLPTNKAQMCQYNTAACICSSGFVSCSNLQEIPPLTTGPNVSIVTSAIFNGGTITSLQRGDLPPLLTTLEFDGHPLTNISDDAFGNSSTSLNQVIITRSHLRSLPETLLILTNLTSLVIIDTHIEDWNPDILQHIAKTLTNLEFRNVGLLKWPEWYSDFNMLTTIDLSENPFESLPADAFNLTTNNLLTLKLSQCNFTNIPAAFSILRNLTGLDISGNNISDSEIVKLASLPFTTNLEQVTLSSMELTKIPNFSNMTSLKTLFLDNNQISNADKNALPWSLTILNMENNKLTSIPTCITELPNLSTLNLTFNELTVISLDLFPRQLEKLYLSYNKITKILDAASEEQSNLESLSLGFNPVTDISPWAFKNLVLLNQLNLQSTRLDTLPGALSSLKHLTTVQMTDNVWLYCTYPPPPELTRWFKSFPGGLIINGKCNSGIDITDYLLYVPTKIPAGSQGTQTLSWQTTENVTVSSTDSAVGSHFSWFLCLFFALCVLI